MENIYIIGAVATGCRRNWEEPLNFSSEEISAIELKKCYQVEECCQEVLKRWLNGQARFQMPITFNTLLLAIADANCVTVPALQVQIALTFDDSKFERISGNTENFRLC